MLEIISSKKEIGKYQKLFINELEQICKEKVKCKVGFQGGSLEVELHYSKKYNFWFCSKEDTNKHWNAFGLGQPKEGRMMTITVEINTPFEGINRMLGGAFCSNELGEVFLMFRGNIRGGRKRVNKDLFVKWYPEPFMEVKEGHLGKGELVAIGKLGDPSLGSQISSFVEEVYEIKQKRNDETVFEDMDLNVDKFLNTDEPAGTRRPPRYSGEVTVLRHGEIVNTLKNILTREGFKVKRDRRRDLCIINDQEEIVTIFEIKPSNSFPNVYTALGQLLFYNMLLVNKAKLVMVLPRSLSNELESKIYQLGITIQYFSWKDGKPDFTGFDLEQLRLS